MWRSITYGHREMGGWLEAWEARPRYNMQCKDTLAVTRAEMMYHLGMSSSLLNTCALAPDNVFKVFLIIGGFRTSTFQKKIPHKCQIRFEFVRQSDCVTWSEMCKSAHVGLI